MMVTDIGSSTVETVADRDAVRYPFQRKGFYARGYHWAFYYASGEIYWRKSADGTSGSWGTANEITPVGETPEEGDEIAVWLDRHEEPAQKVHIVYADHNLDSHLWYRKGTIDVNGNLTWDAVWQIAVALEIGYSYSNVTICVDDTNGYPFIGYKHTLRATPSSNSKPMVTHCQTGTGTWSTFAGFPDVLNTTNDDTWICTVVPYSGDDIMAVYARDGNNILYDIYDITGDSWDGEEDTGVTLGDSVKTSVTSQRATVSDAQLVHVAYCDGNDDLKHIRIEAAGVTGPTLIYASGLAMAPSISTRIYGGDVNHYRTLYVFWTPITNEPQADYVCYKKSVDVGLTWTKEDGTAGVELWVDETGAELSGVDIASSYFEEQHHATLPESYLGILYTNEGASPDYVRFAGLEFADPDEDLLCKFETQSTADLLGKADVGQDSQDLFGKADVGQGRQDLLGRFEAQSTAELLGKGIIRHTGIPRELVARCIIRHSNTEDLKANVEIVPWEDLYCKSIIRHTATPLNLPAIFWTRFPRRLWTSRRYINGVIELDEKLLGDAILEYVIEGVMEDTQGYLDNAGLPYSEWTDITLVPVQILRA
ncbi:MAG: hypothetical protein KAT53_10125, partial [Dehalococcoidia bacterium]|nr:hypothetical protein [Dehalococcoidia bacterium]